jgi:hypothetical protein
VNSTRGKLCAGCAGALALGVFVVAGLLESASASDDWDWGAVEEMDDAPVTRPAAPASPTAPAGVATESNYAQLRREAANAAPDFERERVAALSIFAGVGPFSVVPARRDRDMHPCANCHQWVLSNPEPRKLAAPHDNFELQHGMHGKGGFWCLTCHDAENNMALKTFEGEPVDYEHAYVVCTQCHVQQGRDWARGAHGKRVGGWDGERQVYNCTACHYQHRPAIKPREPEPGPVMRVGLPRPDHWVAADQRHDHAHDQATDWQRDIDRRREAPEPESSSDTAAMDSAGEPDAES